MNENTTIQATTTEESVGLEDFQSESQDKPSTAQGTEEGLVELISKVTTGHLVGWRLHVTTIGLVAPYCLFNGSLNRIHLQPTSWLVSCKP